MLRSLDPHTAFLNPEAYEGMREKQQTSFYGLGILVGVRNGQLTVISPLEGTPAARLGIQAGDVISTIEGEPTETMTLDEAVGKLKGPKGTQVKISITRRGLPQPLTMSVTRAEILSGALQARGRGLIVGTPSWGKGLVQTVYNLSYRAGLALTTAKYYTPSGRLIQRDYTSYFDYYTHADAGSPEVTGKAVDPKDIFHTDLGRNVYGGGGITPDVIVKDQDLSPFEQFLLARNAFLNFAVDYASRNKVKADWKPDANKVIAELSQWLIKEKLATQEEMDKNLTKQEVRDSVILQIRAEIANSTSGQEARHRVLSEGDIQLQQALKLFDRAANMYAQRREKGPKIEQGSQTKGM